MSFTRLARVVLAVGAVLAGMGTMRAATSPAASATPEPPSVTSTVLVAVTHADGKPVTDLSARDVVIEADGREARVLSCERSAAPVSLALVIDVDEVDDMLAARRAIRRLGEQLHALAPGSLMGVVLFRDPAVRLVPADDVSALEGQAAQLHGTSYALLEGIVQGARHVGQAGSSSRRAVLAIGRISRDRRERNPERFMTEAVAALRESEASLWAVELAPLTVAPGTSATERFLDTVARQSGGRTSLASDVTALDATLEAITTLIGHQYLVTYEAEGPAAPAGRGTLRVGVRRAGVSVYARGWVRD